MKTTILNPEDEILLCSIIESKDWNSIPSKVVFLNALYQVKTDSDEDYKPIMEKLIKKIESSDYDELVQELNFILSYPV